MNTITTSGLDTAFSIPAGAVLEGTFWCVPTLYTSGDDYGTHRAALEAGIARKEEELGKAAEVRGDEASFIPETINVDLRWLMKWEPTDANPAGGIDMVATRYSYPDLATAREALARIIKYSR